MVDSFLVQIGKMKMVYLIQKLKQYIYSFERK